MNPALVVIDMQKRWVPGPSRLYPDLDEAVEIINYVAEKFRAGKRPVIWVQDCETLDKSDPDFAIISALDVKDSDLRASKVASNAFVEPALPEALDRAGADFALLCGYRAEGCVLATARGAADRDLDHALLRGAVLSPADDAPAFIERICPLMSYEIAVAIAARRS